jgi:flagellar basal-body rod protein FlgF
MDRMIYVTSSGARAAMQRQEVLSHNLANVSTVGFRAELHALRAVPVKGDAPTTRAFTLETTVGYDEQSGPMQQTGRPLDVAVDGAGWLAVQGIDGSEAYTRAGAFDLSPQGALTTRSGLAVLGDGGPINLPPNAELHIGTDGSITAKVGNEPPNVVGRLKLVQPEAKLVRGQDGLFRASDGEPLPASDAVRVRNGALEGSNVSPVETMVAMISAARQFEHQMKILQTAEKQEQSASRLLSGNSG